MTSLSELDGYLRAISAGQAQLHYEDRLGGDDGVGRGVGRGGDHWLRAALTCGQGTRCDVNIHININSRRDYRRGVDESTTRSSPVQRRGARTLARAQTSFFTLHLSGFVTTRSRHSPVQAQTSSARNAAILTIMASGSVLPWVWV